MATGYGRHRTRLDRPPTQQGCVALTRWALGVGVLCRASALALRRSPPTRSPFLIFSDAALGEETPPFLIVALGHALVEPLARRPYTTRPQARDLREHGLDLRQEECGHFVVEVGAAAIARSAAGSSRSLDALSGSKAKITRSSLSLSR
jgi:hypothetical protein